MYEKVVFCRLLKSAHDTSYVCAPFLRIVYWVILVFLLECIKVAYYKLLNIRDLVLGLIPVESFNQERTPSMLYVRSLLVTICKGHLVRMQFLLKKE